MNIETYVWRNLALVLICSVILAFLLGFLLSRSHKLLKFLDHNSRLLLWVFVISSAFLWFYAELARPFALKTSLADLGIYSNSLCNTLNGRFLSIDMGGGSLFNWHFSPSFLLLLPFFTVFPGNQILFLSQSLAIASGGLAIWLIAGRYFTKGLDRLLFAFIWLVSVHVRGAALFDFHETAMVAVLILWLAYSVLAKKTIWMWVLALALLGWREDASIYLGLLSLIFVLVMNRKREGLLLLGLSLIYYLMLQLFLWNAVAPRHVDFVRIRFPHLFNGSDGLIASLFTNPLRLLYPFASWDKLWGMFMFYLPLCFLPFLNRGWFISVIGVFYILSINYFNYYFFNTHYSIIIFAILMLLSVPGWLLLRRKLAGFIKYLAPLMGLLSLSLAFAMPEGEIFELLHPAAYARHPEMDFIKHTTEMDPSQVAVSADRKLGSLFFRQIHLNRFPSNYLNERIIVTNTFMFHPRFLIAIGTLGYGLEANSDSFWSLGLGATGNAKAQYMERLRWTEAEGCFPPSFTMQEDAAATKGSAVFLARCWGSRFSYSPEYGLPPGEYRFKLRLRAEKVSPKPNRNFFEAEVRFKDRKNNQTKLSYEKVNCDNWNDTTEYHEVLIPFTVKAPGRVSLQIEFSKVGDVWWDGIGIDGISSDFDELYTQLIPLSIEGSQISPTVHSLKAKGVGSLQIIPAQAGSLVGRWVLPSSIPSGEYTLFYEVKNELGQGELAWGKVLRINSGNPNQVLQERILCSSFGSDWQPGINIESTNIEIQPGDVLEFYAETGLKEDVELIRLWLTQLPD